MLDIEACRRCSLGQLRADRGGWAVPARLGSQPRKPLIAFMGEAPGAQEDATGLPFVGVAGRILDGILQECGLSREQVLLLNRIRCRPPNNSLDSYPDAVYQCNDWTKQELALYDPKVVVLMGKTALKAVFGATAMVGATRGKARKTGAGFEYGERVWVPTYHPASLISSRHPENRAVVVADVRLAKELA